MIISPKTIYQKGSATIGIIIGVSVLITVGLMFYTWKQLLPNLISAHQSKNQLKSEVSDLKAKLDEIKQAQSVVNHIKPSLSSLELALPNNDQFPEMLVMMDAMAQDSGLTDVSTLNLGTTDASTTNTDSYKPATFSITASGFYENAIVFLDNLYNNIRTVEINTITLSTAGESEGGAEGATLVPGQLTFTFSGFTYSRPDAAISVEPPATKQTSSTNANTSSNTGSSKP